MTVPAVPLDYRPTDTAPRGGRAIWGCAEGTWRKIYGQAKQISLVRPGRPLTDDVGPWCNGLWSNRRGCRNAQQSSRLEPRTFRRQGAVLIVAPSRPPQDDQGRLSAPPAGPPHAMNAAPPPHPGSCKTPTDRSNVVSISKMFRNPDAAATALRHLPACHFAIFEV